MRAWFGVGMLVAVVATGCGSDSHSPLSLGDDAGAGDHCGRGTHVKGGLCVADPSDDDGLVCGLGAHIEDGVCLPGKNSDDHADMGTECGPGTRDQGGVCVAEAQADAGSRCGSGTHAQAGQCVADDAAPKCGSGTQLQGGWCVGSHGPIFSCVKDGGAADEDGGTCAGSIGYQLRASTTMIPADGHTKIPLLAIGTNPDGTPATDFVVLDTSRSGAGSFMPTTTMLSVFGSTVYFVPCNSKTPGCTGPVTFTLALAAAPDEVAASIDVMLVEPDGVGSAAPCLTGGNVMFFDGNDFIYNGKLTVTLGTWSATGTAKSVGVHVTPSGQSQGLWWDLNFNSTQLATDLVTGVYEDAERASFASPDHPGIDVGGDGRGCNTIKGRFQVHDYQIDSSNTVTSVTISFEQHCEGGTSVLNGCVHYAE